MEGNFARGADYLFRGARLLTHPALRLFVIVPLLVNIIIFASLLGFTFSFLGRTINEWMAALPGWLGFLEWIIWPLLVAVFGLIAGYTFTAVALLIASPFNNLLAEKAEELLTGQPVDALEGPLAALLSVPRALLRELAKLAYYIPSFVPGVNLAAPLLWFLLGAWMMSIQFVDYPVDNHQLGFAAVKSAVARKRLSSLGFGGVVALCAGIPVINFFVVPAAVVGATLLWCEELREQ